MKYYKIEVTMVPEQGPYEVIYKQVVEDLDLFAIINAVNPQPAPPRAVRTPMAEPDDIPF